jgi:GNAT superfamily N-acetyltransferase
MEFTLLGWSSEGPTLELDYRVFSYAGKFVMSSTGKAVARNDGDVVGAVAFNEDRTDESTLWIRYVTVHEDRRGQGIGPDLLSLVCERATERGYERIQIAVNNPFAYEAAYRAGFAFTGETTGLAELVCARPADRSTEQYRTGLDRYRERDLSTEEASFLERKQDATPPIVVDSPSDGQS